MVVRKCPQCGRKWYSADSMGDWVCGYCGTKISKKLNEKIADIGYYNNYILHVPK